MAFLEAVFIVCAGDSGRESIIIFIGLFVSKQKAEMTKKEAEELQIPEDNVTAPVSQANDKLTGYKNNAKEQSDSIANALNKTKTAGVAANKARDKIKEVRDKLLALLKEIEGLGTVNSTRLDNLENKLINETDSVREVDREVMKVEKQNIVIKEKITLYTINLEKLRAEKEILEERYKKLPKVCPRQTPVTEGAEP